MASVALARQARPPVRGGFEGASAARCTIFGICQEADACLRRGYLRARELRAPLSCERRQQIPKPGEIAHFVGKDQHKAGVEGMALIFGQAFVAIHQGVVKGIAVGAEGVVEIMRSLRLRGPARR